MLENANHSENSQLKQNEATEHFWVGLGKSSDQGLQAQPTWKEGAAQFDFPETPVYFRSGHTLL